MNKKSLFVFVIVLLSNHILPAQTDDSSITADTVVIGRLAEECSMGNKASCMQLKSCARMMKKGHRYMTGRQHRYAIRTIEKVRKIDSKLADELEMLKSKDPKKFEKVTNVNRERHICIKPEMVEPGNANIVKMIKLNLMQCEIAEQYKKARTQAEKKSLRVRLEKILSQKFEIKNHCIKIKIETADKKLDGCRKNLKYRNKNKHKILGEESKNILG